MPKIVFTKEMDDAIYTAIATPPYPNVDTLAKRIGVSRRPLLNRLTELGIKKPRASIGRRPMTWWEEIPSQGPSL